MGRKYVYEREMAMQADRARVMGLREQIYIDVAITVTHHKSQLRRQYKHTPSRPVTVLIGVLAHFKRILVELPSRADGMGGPVLRLYAKSPLAAVP